MPNTIDALSDDKDGNAVSLAVIDGWDWSNEAKHLFALQAKFNAYFDFIQSGQLYDVRPSARGKKLRIDLISQFPLSDKALKFVGIASQAASQLDVEIACRVVPAAN